MTRPLSPLERASVELQAATGRHHTTADLEWLYRVIKRAVIAERRRILAALREQQAGYSHPAYGCGETWSRDDVRQVLDEAITVVRGRWS